MAWKDRISGRSGQQVLTGANFALYSVVVIALIVLVNWFVNNHDHRLDMTPNKKYSLSEQTRKILKDLPRDVTLYAFDREKNLGEKRDVLQMFSSASNKVQVKYVDPDRQPALAKEYGVRNYGTVVVAAGDRHMEASGDGEEGITNALVRVLKGQRTVCFISTHGEHSLDSSERDGYEHFKTQLANENYQTQTLPFLQKMEIPDDCTMVVIAGPQNDYLPQETAVIDKYVQGGGRALVMLDAGVAEPNLAKMVGDWGVTASNDLVIDENPVSQIFGTEPYMPLIVKYGSNPIVQPLNGRATLFPLTRSFEVAKDKPGVSDESLCDTSSDSYGRTDWTPEVKQIEFRANKDVKGPLSVAVAGTLSASGDKKQGRFVVLGTSQIAENNILTFQSNRDFVMNSVNWLSEDQDLISIRATPPESQHLNMNAEQMRRLLILGVFGIPVIIIVLGTLVWWQRR